MNFFWDERGTTAIEYALIASMFTMMAAGALGPMREGLGQLWGFADEVDEALGD